MAKTERYTTPKGVALWPWLTKPDSRPIKGKPQKPAFKVNLALEGQEAADLIAKLDKLVDAAYDKAISENPKKKKLIVKAFPYSAETDDNGDDTGRTIFKFKQNAEIKLKSGETVQVKIPLFDVKGKLLPKGVTPYGGSVVKVSFSTRPYLMDSTNGAGISMDLGAVQVIDLVASTGGNAGSYGFGSDEEGYEADDNDGDFKDESAEDTDTKADDGDEEF